MKHAQNIQIQCADVPATPVVLDDLRRIYRTTWPTTYGPLLPPQIVDAMLAELDDPELISLRAEGAERICLATVESDTAANRSACGAAITRKTILANGETSLLVWGFYVLPDWQGRGIGTTMMASIATQDPMIERLDLSVLAANTRTLEFYRRLGFKPIQERVSEILPGIEARVVELMKPLR